MTDPLASEKKPGDGGVKIQQILLRIISVLITVVLLAELIGRVEWNEFGDLIGQVPPLSWAGALLVYLALNLFRALRFRILLDKGDTPWRILIPITLYHNFLVRALPFKLGELSYIVLLRSRLNYSMEEGLSSLFGARILELLTIVTIFAGSILASIEQLAAQQDELIFLIVFTFVLSVVGLYFGGSILRSSLQPLLKRFQKQDGDIATGINASLTQLANEMDRIRQPRLFIAALIITCFTYSSSFLTNYILLVALGIEAPFSAIVSIISLGMFASALPSVSGFGVLEAAWSLGLIQLAGWPESYAISTGFLLHGFQVLAAALYGLVGYLLIQSSRPLPTEPALAINTASEGPSE